MAMIYKEGVPTVMAMKIKRPDHLPPPRREKDLFPASAYLLQVALMCFTLETFRSACSILPISFFSLG